ncbi:NAD(P)-dependent alcohol dehydrogenase [Bythopirellula polymerisocia]|uniref:Quinone oxidoreductase 1 n=1 Tax=Bythopirellula polymerisocia TaxID=2528003 RepID=A0A5C6CUF9_9BACT|nr:NAD(P)-dependent alcohol dehydrogenase [Bythopirellula polymerisocia]TWU27495.1 Quinone oxidoreductase 1 [Bythopirellula polymerisocia]
MRAIIYKDYGDPSVLQLAEVAQPKPEKDEVLIRVMAAGVNPVEARLRSGEARFLIPGGFPRIPGYDVAGIVEACGDNGSFSVGDRVLAYLYRLYGGAYAEFVTCRDRCVAAIPAAMPFEEAAAIPLAGSTALQSLRDHGHMQASNEVLVNGGSGGVGAFAVQIAKANGARVTAVASGKHEDFVRSLGADDFINYEDQNFSDLDRRWDIVFDAAGKSSFRRAKRVMNETGYFVSTEPSFRGLVMSLATLPCKKKGRIMLAIPRAEDLRELVRMYSADQLKVTVAETFSHGDAEQAHVRIEKGGFSGKLVLNIAE